MRPRNLDQVLSHFWCVCKCNQALIVGFGDNDHAIGELMRFIELTSRRHTNEDDSYNGGAPNYKR